LLEENENEERKEDIGQEGKKTENKVEILNSLIVVINE